MFSLKDNPFDSGGFLTTFDNNAAKTFENEYISEHRTQKATSDDIDKWSGTSGHSQNDCQFLFWKIIQG